jgi:hypothetical protein
MTQIYYQYLTSLREVEIDLIWPQGQIVPRFARLAPGPNRDMRRSWVHPRTNLIWPWGQIKTSNVM